jgi:hypothetical protein
VKECKICKENLNVRERHLCKKCRSLTFELSCPECNISRIVTAAYFWKAKLSLPLCSSCARIGEKSTLRIRKKLETEELRRQNGFRKTYTQEGREKLSKASSKRYTEEYKKAIRVKYEEKGTWTKLKELEDYEFYKRVSHWKSQVLTENTIGVEKLKHGNLYSKTRDKNDLVRDHMFSRRQGFTEKVFPEILRHPANCQLLTHVDNLNKSKTTNDSSLTLEELFSRIKQWTLIHEEHSKCLELIEKYCNGERYNKSNYL